MENEEVERQFQVFFSISCWDVLYTQWNRESMGGSLLLTWKMVYVYGILPAEAGKY